MQRLHRLAKGERPCAFALKRPDRVALVGGTRRAGLFKTRNAVDHLASLIGTSRIHLQLPLGAREGRRRLDQQRASRSKGRTTMTTLPAFRLETHFSRLGVHGAPPHDRERQRTLSMAELLSCADDADRDAWERLTLGYTETHGGSGAPQGDRRDL